MARDLNFGGSREPMSLEWVLFLVGLAALRPEV